MFSRLRLGLRNTSFNLSWFLGDAGKSDDWISTFHDLQLCFGVKEFLVWFNIVSSDSSLLSEI